MNGMLPWAISFALIAVALAMIFAAIRLLRGPAAEDRVLALDTLYVNSMILVLTLLLRRTDWGLAMRASIDLPSSKESPVK